MVKHFCYLLLCTITITSCSRTVKLNQELFQLQSQKIVLPITQMKTYVNGRDTVLLNLDSCRLKLVVYSDSTECSTCMVEKIHVWDSLLLKTMKYEPQFKIFFIFSPTKKQRHDVEFLLRTRQFSYPVFLIGQEYFHNTIRIFQQTKYYTPFF